MITTENCKQEITYSLHLGLQCSIQPPQQAKQSIVQVQQQGAGASKYDAHL